MAAIHAVPAFSDNYIWLLENSDGSALVVDPGDARPVREALEARGLSLSGILVTHHHFDHVGGVDELVGNYGCTVYGPDNPAIGSIDHVLRAGDAAAIGDYRFEILAVPGHTLDHIAYFQAGPEALLFCGDTLFAGGCGRIFEGDPAMMHASLSALASLPPETRVYCAHEYTLANLAFARAADPHNPALRQREEDAKETRAAGRATVPSTIELELATNPFLRSGQDSLRDGLQSAGRDAGSSAVETFAQLRRWKDSF